MAKFNHVLAFEEDLSDIPDLTEMDESDLIELQDEATEELRLNNRALETIEITLDLCDQLKKKPNLSMEDIGFFQQSLDLSLTGLPYKNTAFSAALESSQNPQEIVLAVEGEAIHKLQDFSTMLRNRAEKILSVVKYQFSFFNSLEKKLQETIRKVELNKNSDKKSITVRVDRWLCYGENKQITSFSEYLTELNKANEAIENTLKIVTEFNNEVRFLGPKVLFSFFPVLVDIWKVFRKTASTVFSFVFNMTKIPGMSKFKQTQSASYYETNTLLGLFRIIAVMPKNMMDIENADPDEDATRQEIANFLKFVDIGIETQRFYRENTGSVTFENVTKADILKMLRSMESMAINYQEFNKAVNRLMNLYHGASLVTTAIAPMGVANIAISYYISYRYRILLKVDFILAGMMGQTYKIANKTLKKGIEIAQKY